MFSIEFPDPLTPASFLKQYWQRKPLYMPGAWPDFSNPLSAEELAGFALDEQMPARIIEQHSMHKWSVRSGPFREQDFAALDGKTWSLLITDMEKHLPDLMAYVQPFRFIPDWRFDDLMISYAPAGGSVGPHIDDYDTFLIQAEGQREWQIEADARNLPQPDTDLIADTELRLIKNFKAKQTLLCSPGDILYLPPRIGHHGVAKTDCMTWSVGFKAPSFQDMLFDYLDAFSAENEHRRFTDKGLAAQTYPGEITQLQIQSLKRWFNQQIEQNDDLFTHWLGKYLSQHDDASIDDILETAQEINIDSLQLDNIQIEVNPFVRFHFIRQAEQTFLYVGGEAFEVSLKLANQLTNKSKARLRLSEDLDKRTVEQLIKRGWIHEVA